MSGRRYVLITPCRDEARFARRTLDSVAAQTVPPALWVIVDDGSKDETPQILAEYEAKLPYLRVIRRKDRGFRHLGGGVMDAFYEGYHTIDPSEFFRGYQRISRRRSERVSHVLRKSSLVVTRPSNAGHCE